MNAWKVILATLVIYTAGVVTGSFATGLKTRLQHDQKSEHVGRPRPPMMKDLVRRMEARLDLTPDQKILVHEIVEASQTRMRTLMDEMRPKLESESQSMRQEIEAILSETQMATFGRVFEHRGRRGSGGRGPGMRGGGRGPGGGMRGEGRHEGGRRGGPNRGEDPANNQPQRPGLESAPEITEGEPEATDE